MHRDVHSRRQMKITHASQYWIIQYFSFFTAPREKKMFVQYVLQFFKLLLHHGLTSLALKQIYRVENLPLSLLFSEHGQKLVNPSSAQSWLGAWESGLHAQEVSVHLWRMEVDQVCGYIAVFLLQKVPSPTWAKIFRVQYTWGFFRFLNGRSWYITMINTLICCPGVKLSGNLTLCFPL